MVIGTFDLSLQFPRVTLLKHDSRFIFCLPSFIISLWNYLIVQLIFCNLKVHCSFSRFLLTKEIKLINWNKYFWNTIAGESLTLEFLYVKLGISKTIKVYNVAPAVFYRWRCYEWKHMSCQNFKNGDFHVEDMVVGDQKFLNLKK